MLASEYGWAYTEIMDEIGMLDVIVLTDMIKARTADNYIIQAQIASYPHMEQKDRDKFIKELRSMSNIQEEQEEIDSAKAIDLIKGIMSKSRGVQVK